MLLRDKPSGGVEEYLRRYFGAIVLLIYSFGVSQLR